MAASIVNLEEGGSSSELAALKRKAGDLIQMASEAEAQAQADEEAQAKKKARAESEESPQKGAAGSADSDVGGAHARMAPIQFGFRGTQTQVMR